jgi:hypothetical protein
MNSAAGGQNASKREAVKDALAAASLALLCLVRIWNAMLASGSRFFTATPRSRIDYAALLINMAVLTAAFWLGARCVRRYRSSWVQNAGWAGMLLCLLPLVDFLRRAAGLSVETVLKAGWILIAAGGLLLYFRRRALPFYYQVLLALSPLTIVALAYAGYGSLFGESPVTRAISQFSPNDSQDASSMRVIWVVFDELDQRVTLEARPAGLDLPQLDEFAKESIRATAAFPPAGQTLLSIPALLSGREVEDVRVRSDDILDVRFAGSAESVQFPPQDSPLPRLVAAGRNVAVMGWYLPYERLFPAGPHCFSRGPGFPDYQGFRGTTVPEAVSHQFRFVAMPNETRLRDRAVFDELHATVLQAAKLPAIDLVFAHYSVPHMPGISDPHLTFWGSMTTTRPNQYFGNLRFVDRAIGDIRQALQESHLDRRTAVLITSDHWWRRSMLYDGRDDHRVPFLVRMPDGKSGTVSRGFDVVNTARLVESILDGKIRSSDDVLTWLRGFTTKQAFSYSASGVRHR